MDVAARRKWFRIVLLVGAIYFVIAVSFGVFADWTSSISRVTWNRLAFLTSAVTFGAHILYERFRLNNSSVTIASHVSLAVALGAFALAVSANIHGWRFGSSQHRALAFALVAWPVITAVPAFLVALIAAAVLTLRRSSV
jgi:hypothetical protein